MERTMIKIVVDPILRNQLERLSEPAQLCDESGKLLGQFVPTPSADEFEEPPISREELNRRKASTEWYTTEEVLKHLRSQAG
jgi:hypothetical protein